MYRMCNRDTESETFLQVNYREPPTTLYGERIKKPFYYTSHSNVDRVKVTSELSISIRYRVK